jgi:hypothetical protein
MEQFEDGPSVAVVTKAQSHLYMQGRYALSTKVRSIDHTFVGCRLALAHGRAVVELVP